MNEMNPFGGRESRFLNFLLFFFQPKKSDLGNQLLTYPGQPKIYSLQDFQDYTALECIVRARSCEILQG